MSASFGLGRFREKYVKDNSAALSSRRNRRGDDFSRTAARRPPQGTHCTSALHFSDRIHFCLYYSTLPHPTQQNFYFVALGKRTVQRTKNSRVLFGHFGYRIFRFHFPCFYLGFSIISFDFTHESLHKDKGLFGFFQFWSVLAIRSL